MPYYKVIKTLIDCVLLCFEEFEPNKKKYNQDKILWRYLTVFCEYLALNIGERYSFIMSLCHFTEFHQKISEISVNLYIVFKKTPSFPTILMA